MIEHKSWEKNNEAISNIYKDENSNITPDQNNVNVNFY